MWLVTTSSWNHTLLGFSTRETETEADRKTQKDTEIERAAKILRVQIFSVYVQLPWQHIQTVTIEIEQEEVL